MIKPIKIRRCLSRTCRQEFTPVKRGLTLSKHCCAACELDHAESTGNVKAKQKAKKPKTASWLKINKLWPIFSLHQKLVHSADGEWCQCYTCDQILKIGTINCQGGHCLPKSVYKNLYFDERAVRPQCVQCNKNRGGMSFDFCEKLKQEIGAEEFEEMKRAGKDIVKRDAKWYLDQIDYYEKQCELIREAKK